MNAIVIVINFIGAFQTVFVADIVELYFPIAVAVVQVNFLFNIALIVLIVIKHVQRQK